MEHFPSGHYPASVNGYRAIPFLPEIEQVQSKGRHPSGFAVFHGDSDRDYLRVSESADG
ncbi:hypothetical protein D3C76_1724330 [compost metagenome]